MTRRSARPRQCLQPAAATRPRRFAQRSAKRPVWAMRRRRVSRHTCSAASARLAAACSSRARAADSASASSWQIARAPDRRGTGCNVGRVATHHVVLQREPCCSVAVHRSASRADSVRRLERAEWGPRARACAVICRVCCAALRMRSSRFGWVRGAALRTIARASARCAPLVLQRVATCSGPVARACAALPSSPSRAAPSSSSSPTASRPDPPEG